MPESILKYDYVETGYCRIYYKFGRHVYCFQDEGRHVQLYRCTTEGEPEIPIKKLNSEVQVELPDGERELEVNVRNHIKENYKCQAMHG
jgi:hypothetical protein